jgi:hypothetical protein
MACFRITVLVWKAERDPLTPHHRNETWVVSAENPDDALSDARRAAQTAGFRVLAVERVQQVVRSPAATTDASPWEPDALA